MSEIIFNSPKSASSLQSQIESLQTTLASLNQQVIFLQETLQEREQQIARLKNQLSECSQTQVISQLQQSMQPEPASRQDQTLTILGALINLYKFFFPPGKVVSH